jgi:hypothetical protein
MIKIALWITATAVGIVTLLALLTFAYFWRSPDYVQAAAAAASESKIIAQSEYSDNHPNPYIYRSGAVVVFGAEHTKDPNDPQIVRIDQQWRDLRPSAALVEGRLGFLAPDVSDEHGLPGYLKTISDDSNDLRNRHLVRAVLELTGKGERVFVVAGSSHAVLIEPALQ